MDLAAGIYWLQGLSLQKDPVAYRRSVGWADADPLYPGFLSGADLLAFYKGIQRPRPGQIEDLSDRFSVRPWLSSRAATWSSGMTKKISLLLAFIGQASLILLDEPLVTLDEDGTAALYNLIREYHTQFGISFVLSSHQNIPANRLLDIKNLILNEESIQLI